MKIALTEDHALIRHGIKSLITASGNEEKYNILAEFSNAEDAWEFLATNTVDILITDINLPKMNGLELAAKVKETYPVIKIMLLSSYDDEEYVTEAISLDIESYILKDSIAEEILKGLERVGKGDSFYSDKVLDVAINSHKKVQKSHNNKDDISKQISPREREVLAKIADGHKNSEIAEMLFISERTVETHRSSLLKKFNSKSSAEMIKKAIMKNII